MQAERFLCRRDKKGNIIRDRQENPVLNACSETSSAAKRTARFPSSQKEALLDQQHHGPSKSQRRMRIARAVTPTAAMVKAQNPLRSSQSGTKEKSTAFFKSMITDAISSHRR